LNLQVVKKFDTVAMKEALKTARFLVRLSKKKKEEDSQVLEKSLKRDLAESDPRPEALLQPKTEPMVPQQQRAPTQQQQQQQVQSLNAQTQQQQPLQQPQIPIPMMDDQQQISWEQGPLTTSSGEDWNMDYLNNTEFDWNFFLSQDIPAFQNLAPDGMM
jgi:DNA primase